MQIQTVSNESGEPSTQPFIVIYKDGSMLAISAVRYEFQPGGDWLQFYKAHDVPNKSRVRVSHIRTIVAKDELAEVPAFIEMQNQFTKIMERLDKIEDAVF
jgi:hypothetical protein